jgi:hypothetical protein
MTGVTTNYTRENGFDIYQNIASKGKYASMFGLTPEEMKDTLKMILKDKMKEVDRHYGIMEQSIDCSSFADGVPDKVFNTNSCLEYFREIKFLHY